MDDEERHTRIQSEFLRRARFQVELSKALDRALSNPSRDMRTQQALVDALVYCLNEIDVAFGNPADAYPAFSENAFQASQKYTLLHSENPPED